MICNIVDSRRQTQSIAFACRFVVAIWLSLSAINCDADVNDALLALFPPSTQAPINSGSWSFSQGIVIDPNGGHLGTPMFALAGIFSPVWRLTSTTTTSLTAVILQHGNRLTESMPEQMRMETAIRMGRILLSGNVALETFGRLAQPQHYKFLSLMGSSWQSVVP